jgi:hypothetical protein
VSDHTPYQKGIIKRFYEHRDTLALQKLGEIVSNLYLETNEGKINRLWKSAHAQMIAAGVHEHEAGNVLKERDLGAMAKIISRLS